MNLETMTDKEVGNIWRMIQPGRGLAHYSVVVAPLIRKFILDAAERLALVSNVEYFQDHALEVVLTKYDIDIGEW